MSIARVIRCAFRPDMDPAWESRGSLPKSTIPSRALVLSRPHLRVRRCVYRWSGSERPHFDAPQARLWHSRGHPDSVIQIPSIDEVKATELLLRLGEGTVGGGQL